LRVVAGRLGSRVHPSLLNATRVEGRRRLAAFLPRAGTAYNERRNFVAGPDHANVSGLSPWVQKRLLLEEELVAAARLRWGFHGAEKFIQETYWRTYWKGWLERRPEVWTRWRAAVPRLRAELTPERRAIHEAARAGRTDLACFNAWAKELTTTGWLHNHARMWFASIWIFTLRLPWELGAAFFYEHLLDGDAASNTLSWRWVAGLQTPGKTYLARADNIAKYQGDDLAPAAYQLAAEAFAITEAPLRQVAPPERPTRWTELASGVGAGPVGLWLHPEDLVPEESGLADAPVGAVFAGWPAGIATRAGWSPAVTTWTRAALSDGAARAGAHFGCAVTGGDGEAPDGAAEAVVAWARRERLTTVLAHETATGPWREEGEAVEAALGAAGVRLIWIRRAWDARWWPHATRGYFPFWEGVKRAESA
jgi:hypothetical protein